MAVLFVTDLLLLDDINPASATAALLKQASAGHIQVTLKHLKPLFEDVSVDMAQFLISWLDHT